MQNDVGINNQCPCLDFTLLQLPTTRTHNTTSVTSITKQVMSPTIELSGSGGRVVSGRSHHIATLAQEQVLSTWHRKVGIAGKYT